jgi:uncharacterized protein YeaO (DUF488 family)
MAVRIVRLGAPRVSDEGLRLGTVRRPPRGVPRGEFARRDYYDVWLPELSPSAPVVAWALSTPWTPQRWRTYVRRYVTEMKQPAAQHLLATLAALSRQTNFSVGCYCEDATHCHRRLLAELLAQNGADLTGFPSLPLFVPPGSPS